MIRVEKMEEHSIDERQVPMKNAWLWLRRKHSSSGIAHSFQLAITAYPHMFEDVMNLWESKENVRKSQKSKLEMGPT